MGKEVIKTDEAPAAVGAYSQAVVAGEFLFAAGQIGLDPVSGALVGEDVSGQTSQILDNLAAILEAAQVSFNDVVKSTIYLQDIGDFPVVNDLYKERFGEKPPARSTVAVAGLPLGAKVEIDMVAYVGESNIP
jgi:2-iminobutanoate/2-iminopropanoate deaminase